jgi:hypothetical protein
VDRIVFWKLTRWLARKYRTTIKYIEPGYIANDDRDGDISKQVIVSGNINTNVLGSYILTYTVSDIAGNTTISRRYVNVIEKTYCRDFTSKLIDHEAGHRARSEIVAGWWWLPPTTIWYAIGSNEKLGTNKNTIVTLTEQPPGNYFIGSCP